MVITTAQLHSTKPELRFWFKPCSRRAGDSRWWGSLAMVPAGNKAKRLSSVSHTTKTIHHHHHQVTARKTFCSEKVVTPKKMTAAKRWLFWKRKLLKKRSIPEEIAASKKLLFYQSSYSGVVWRSSFSKNKTVLKNRYKCEKGNEKLNQWLRLIEIIFPARFLHPNKYSWKLHMSIYHGGRNRPKEK